MNLNKVIIAGRMTVDPELRTTSSGNSVTSFGVATNRYWTNKQGEKQEEVEFHNVVVWGRQAEVVNQFLSKGSLVMIEGRLQTRDWEGKDGQKKRTTEIIAEKVQFGPKNEDGGGFGGGQKNQKKDKNSGEGSQSDAKADAHQDEEEMPEIDIDDLDDEEDDDIKGENVPF